MSEKKSFDAESIQLVKSSSLLWKQLAGLVAVLKVFGPVRSD